MVLIGILRNGEGDGFEDRMILVIYGALVTWGGNCFVNIFHVIMQILHACTLTRQSTVHAPKTQFTSTHSRSRLFLSEGVVYSVVSVDPWFDRVCVRLAALRAIASLLNAAHSGLKLHEIDAFNS